MNQIKVYPEWRARERAARLPSCAGAKLRHLPPGGPIGRQDEYEKAKFAMTKVGVSSVLTAPKVRRRKAVAGSSAATSKETSSGRGSRAVAATASAKPESGAGDKTNRLTRTRLRTRSKLIAAARSVMGRKGYDAATISDITEEADVGFGSFYNHFQSKEEVARAVFAERAEQLAVCFESVRDSIQDIALAQSVIQRLWIELARHDPLWGWFNIHAEIALQQMNETFRDRIAADICKGNKRGRYKVEAVETAATLTISSLMSTMRMVLEGRGNDSAASEMAEFILRMYGMPLQEAAELARQPLPKITRAMIDQFGESPSADLPRSQNR